MSSLSQIRYSTILLCSTPLSRDHLGALLKIARGGRWWRWNVPTVMGYSAFNTDTKCSTTVLHSLSPAIVMVKGVKWLPPGLRKFQSRVKVGVASLGLLRKVSSLTNHYYYWICESNTIIAIITQNVLSLLLCHLNQIKVPSSRIFIGTACDMYCIAYFIMMRLSILFAAARMESTKLKVLLMKLKMKAQGSDAIPLVGLIQLAGQLATS